jgi:hypothetical protein
LAAKGSGLFFSLCSPAEGISNLTQQLSGDAEQLQLFYHVYAGPSRAAEEEAVAAAFREAAGGIPCSTHTSWSHTMYHPQDAVQALAQHRSSSRARSKGQKRPVAQSAFPPDGDAAQLTRDTSLFKTIPPVMTDFRKVIIYSAAPFKQHDTGILDVLVLYCNLCIIGKC